MFALRRHLLKQAWPVLLALLAVLAVRIAVPMGYMVVAAPGGITVELCSGKVMALPATLHDAALRDGTPDPSPVEDRGVEQPCAFTGLSAPMLGAVEPLLSAAALLERHAAALWPIAPPLLRPAAHLRPPLRGPPSLL